MLRIYERDAYVFEFEAAVTSADKEWIALDATAFYPGGGGQVSDTGRICGLAVTEVKPEGENILHRVPGHALKAGDTVWCTVDWERRYDLMIGHTAEHLFFGALKREDPDIDIVKIFISPESKYVVVDRDVGWDVIGKAQDSVNRAVKDDLAVIRSTMSRNDPELKNIRVKLERIDGEFLTVVEIGDADAAACSGIHVRETGEIGAFLADRKVSAGKDGYAIHFRVGADALARSTDLANKFLRMTDIMGTKPEDAVCAAQNLKRDCDVRTKQLRAAIARMIDGLIPETVCGVPVYSGLFGTDDRTVITEAAERIKNAGGVAVLLAAGGSLSVTVSSGVKNVNCSEILKDAAAKEGGRGGGKQDFAQGGVPDAAKADIIMSSIMRSVKEALK